MEERWHFNTDVALAMTFYNDLSSLQETTLSDQVRPEVLKAAIEILVLVLALFTPHIADELWKALGHQGSTLQVRWPAFDPALAAEEEVEIPVQVNGRLRARIRASASAGEDDLRALALAEHKIQEHLNGRQVVKVVVVPGKLVNLVVK
jgi:leucyl-tRNA synthetase